MSTLDPGSLRLAPLTREQAEDVVTWRYPAPYDLYDMDGASPDDLADPEAGFYAVLADDRLVGFRSFGPDGRVPGWDYDDAALDTGGGLRPELTGQGLGRAVVAAGLAYGRARFAPPAFRMTIASFNARALRTVRGLGFEEVATFAAARDGREFRVLLRPERPAAAGQLRPATEDDLVELVAVQEEASVVALAHLFPQDAHPFPRAAVLDRWREELRDPGIAVYVAADDAGAITGFAARRDDELLHFGTAMHTWGTGLASRLHDELLATWPAGTPRLWLRVFEENHRARRFWSRHGWRPTGGRSRSPFPPHPVLLDHELVLGPTAWTATHRG